MGKLQVHVTGGGLGGVKAEVKFHSPGQVTKWQIPTGSKTRTVTKLHVTKVNRGEEGPCQSCSSAAILGTGVKLIPYL